MPVTTRTVAAFERLVQVFKWQIWFGLAVVMAGIFLGMLAVGGTRVVLLSSMSGVGLFTAIGGHFQRRKYVRVVQKLRLSAETSGTLPAPTQSD